MHDSERDARTVGRASKLQYPPLNRRAHEMPLPHGWHDEPSFPPNVQRAYRVAARITIERYEEALKKLGCPTEPQP